MNEAIVAEVLKILDRIEKKQDDFTVTLNEHIAQEDTDRGDILARLANLITAFPDGDMKGHSVYHGEVMQSLKDRTVFWKNMRESAVKYGVFGALGWLLLVAWQALLNGPHK